jgi:hypothetical protein
MAQNNTQKVLKNLLRLAVDKQYSIEFRSGRNYKIQIPDTTDYQYIRENYRSYSHSYIFLTVPDTKLPVGYYIYDISKNTIHGNQNAELLTEAQFLTDIGY